MQQRLALLMPAVASLILAALAIPTTSTAAPSSARVAPTLAMTPTSNHVGGMRLTFTGNIGRAGVRKVWVQVHLTRPGDIWRDMPMHSSSTTDAAGNFVVHAPASSARAIAYRVTDGRRSTPAAQGHTQNPDVWLYALSSAGASQGIVGAPLEFSVRSTGPVISGRTLLLQERVREREWATVATTQSDAQGNGAFTLTPTTPGVQAYRVIQADVKTGGHDIGWFPSYPLHVTVAPGGGRGAGSAGLTTPTPAPVRVDEPTSARGETTPRKHFQTTASRTFRWGTPRYDFDWEYGGP